MMICFDYIVVLIVHKRFALLTRIQLDLEMELYLRTEFTQISLAKNYILNFVNLVCLYVPTLRFFTGSRKGLSRGTGDIICTLSSSSVNHSFFPVFDVVYIYHFFLLTND
jgi:hypothetical protein